MNLTDDIILHLKGGAIAAAAQVAVLLLAVLASAPLALALAGPLFGWGIERYQAIRREGVASKRDIVATAIPFEVAAAVWALVG